MNYDELVGAEHILLISQSKRSCPSVLFAVLFAGWARSRNSLIFLVVFELFQQKMSNWNHFFMRRNKNCQQCIPDCTLSEDTPAPHTGAKNMASSSTTSTDASSCWQKTSNVSCYPDRGSGKVQAHLLPSQLCPSFGGNRKKWIISWFFRTLSWKLDTSYLRENQRDCQLHHFDFFFSRQL